MIDKTVRIWDVNTQRHLRTINSARQVYKVAFHPSKQILAVAGGIYLYNPATGQQMSQLGRASNLSVAFHPNGQVHLALGPTDSHGDISIYKLVTANRLDVNKDGSVNINDLIEVARNYGKTGTNNADVNNDKRSGCKRLHRRCQGSKSQLSPHLPLESSNPILPFTAQEVQQWIQDAKKQGVDAEGIATLEQLLQTVLQQAAPATAKKPPS